jgi:hypothetical protein
MNKQQAVKAFYPKRIPCHAALAIDPRPFGYMDPAEASLARIRRLGVEEHGRPLYGPYRNSEARKRAEGQPDHPCYTPQSGSHGEHAVD